MFLTVLLSIIMSTHSNGICHICLLTACEQDQDGTGLGLLQNQTSSVLFLLASCQQTCMSCTIAVCTVKNS